MARRTFFSFHYEADVWRAANVRNSGIVDATSPEGFTDASIWEEAKSKGDAAVRKIIKDALERTSVTVVLIGAKTSTRDWVKYEITESVARGNGLLGIHVNEGPERERRHPRRRAQGADRRGRVRIRLEPGPLR